MTYFKPFLKTASFHHYAFAVAAIILAYEPLMWLVRTWQDPSYDSKGFVVFFVCAMLFTWSASSAKVTCKPINHKLPLALLGLSACVRLLGQVAAINVIGALTLVVDVYALSQIVGLQRRARAVSPFWLAVCFGFSLPLERMIQRGIGYGLQHLSADGACSILGTFYDNVTCHGVRILINAQDVMVDLPCSGARSVLLLLFFYCLCAGVSRFKAHIALFGIGVALISSLIMNMVRICILAIGIAYPVFDIDVMAQPYHDIIGLFTLALGCAPIILWASYFSRPQRRHHPVLDQACWVIPPSIQNDAWWLEPSKPKTYKGHAKVCGTLICIIGALIITNLPRKAMDVARTDIPLSMPYNLDGAVGFPVMLSAQEQAYFTQYGGSAKKAMYGDHGLMMVRTSAPLRHLHAPDECLRGLGMDVEYKGTEYGILPSAIYKATDDQGNRYRIAVSFMPEDHSMVTTNISEAIWRWMQNPGQVWMAVQRISPWDGDPERAAQFDRALTAALDLQTPQSNIHIASIGE